jgi:AraC family transcriptional regulator of adaptative response/methylated-DNA-[protein]-cysteine methyltransferase
MGDYERIADVIRYLDRHHGMQPDLAALAARAGLSTFHFHRLFVRWAGVPPKKFLDCLTVADARARLREGESVLDAALGAGLSGPGRLHDLAVRIEAATPGEIRTGGRGWAIRAGFVATPFGELRVGIAPRGFCHLAFVDSPDRVSAEAAILSDWPRASLLWDDGAIEASVGPLFDRSPRIQAAGPGLRAIVRGTPFQVQVWRALVRIPRGAFASYGAIARRVGRPTSARAVGTAVGANSLAWLIPCHRVIRETGVLGEYRWGRERKAAIAAWEGARGKKT